MALTSGGTTFGWRRKRTRAARLRPVAEDAASTTRLFDGSGRERPGARLPHRHRPEPAPSDGAGPNGRTQPHGSPPPSPPGGPAPLVRYEWRSTSGETLVVEAGWPVPEPPGRPDGTTPAPEPRVDLRS